MSIAEVNQLLLASANNELITLILVMIFFYKGGQSIVIESTTWTSFLLRHFSWISLHPIVGVHIST